MSDEIDASNQYIANQWDYINRSVDMFFTNQQTRHNKSSLFAYSSFTKAEGQSIQSVFDIQVKFDLPNTTKKLKIVIEKQQDEISDALTDTFVTTNKTSEKKGGIQTTKKTQYAAGANYLLTQSKYFVSFIHFGLRIDVPINPSLKLDAQKIFETEHVSIGLMQKFILYRQEGFQEISQLSFSKKLNELLQANLINSLVWTDQSDKFALRNNFIVNQNLGEERSLSYSIGANAAFSPKFHYESYDTSVGYRQLLYKKWLYGNLVLGANFLKSNHFNDDKFIQIRFDLFFKKQEIN